MGNACTRQRTGPHRLPLLSASQIKKFPTPKRSACLRRHGFNRLLGRREPSGKAATKGTAYHREMELWCKLGIVPTSAPARKALKFAPMPRLAEVEVPLRYDLAIGCWLGYIDVAYDWDGKRPQPIGSTGWTVIHDWKFKSSFKLSGDDRNIPTPEEIAEDEAFNLYAYEAFEGGAERVSGRWVFVEMADKPRAKEVWVHADRAKVHAFVGALDAFDAEEIYGLWRAFQEVPEEDRLRFVLDLPINTKHCYDYREPCPFMGECEPESKFKLPMKARSTNVTADMKTAMDKKFPPLPGKTPPALPAKQPPALPAKKGPPPLPKKTDSAAIAAQMKAEMQDDGETERDPSKPESGFVNQAEYQPETMPRNPEEAAALHGVEQPPEPEKDDLDALEGDDDTVREYLKALAAVLGVELKKRARTDTWKTCIRVHRRTHGTTVVLRDGQVVTTMQDAADRDQAEAFDKAQEARAAETKREVIGTINVVHTTKLQPHESPTKAEGFVLYVNCAPSDGSAEPLSGLMADLKVALGKDWRTIQYTGAAELTEAYLAHTEDGSLTHGDLILNTYTPEGGVMLETLSGRAARVVRGF